jgi:hypothetical protein
MRNLVTKVYILIAKRKAYKYRTNMVYEEQEWTDVLLMQMNSIKHCYNIR